MKLLFTSDWQCSLRNLEQCEATLHHIVELIDKQQVSYVVHLGDLKDAFNPVDQRVTNFLVYAVEAITERCRLLVLLGNHDRIGMGDHTHSCLPVLEAAGARTFQEPTLYKFAPNYWIHMVPFLRDAEKQKRILESPSRVPSKDKAILAFHNEIRGSKLNVQTTSTEAQLLPENLQPKRYAACIGGHLHYQQQVRPNVWYVGSPFCHNWGEANQRKGFLLVILDGKEVKIQPVASKLPGMYDPGLPNFPKLRSWSGTKIRIRVPVNDNVSILEQATKQAEKKYPKAELHLVPVYSHPEFKDAAFDRSATEADLIRRYLTLHPELQISTEQAVAFIHSRLLSAGISPLGVADLRMQKVTAENVLCFEKVSLDLATPGITLITGVNKDWSEHSNGAGKTSLVSLPGLALFGRTPKGQHHDEWRRTNSIGPSKVLLTAKLDNDREVQLLRGRNPTKLEIQVAGRDMSMGDIKATQQLIEQITNLTWSVLINSLYVGQREVATVLTGTDKVRKELFSRFLGLDRFLSAQECIKADLRSLDDVMQEVLWEIRVAQNDTLQYEENATKIQSETTVVDLNKIDSLQKEVERLRAEGEAIQIQQQKTLSIRHQQELLSLHSKEARAAERLRAADHQLAQAEKPISRCPVCGSRVTASNLAKHRRELKSNKQTLVNEWKRSSVRSQRCQRKVDVLQEQITSGINQLENLTSLIQRHSLHLQELETAAEQDRRLSAIVKDYREKADHARLIAQRHLNYQQQLQEQKRFLEACRTVVSRDGLPAFLCASVCPQLNRAAQEYSRLFTEEEIQVQFTLQEGDLDVQVINLHGGQGVNAQSQGEMRMAALVTVFAFRDVLVPHNILVLDEPGEGLDSRSAAAFAWALPKVAQRFGSVFITAHNPFMLSELEPDRHLEVVKENGVSTVKEIRK